MVWKKKNWGVDSSHEFDDFRLNFDFLTWRDLLFPQYPKFTTHVDIDHTTISLSVLSAQHPIKLGPCWFDLRQPTNQIARCPMKTIRQSKLQLRFGGVITFRYKSYDAVNKNGLQLPTIPIK